MSLYTRVTFAFRFFTLQLRHGNINTHNTHQANGDWAASCFFTGLVRRAVSLTSTSHFSYTHTDTPEPSSLSVLSETVNTRVDLKTNVLEWILRQTNGSETNPLSAGHTAAPQVWEHSSLLVNFPLLLARVASSAKYDHCKKTWSITGNNSVNTHTSLTTRFCSPHTRRLFYSPRT